MSAALNCAAHQELPAVFRSKRLCRIHLLLLKYRFCPLRPWREILRQQTIASEFLCGRLQEWWNSYFFFWLLNRHIDNRLTKQAPIKSNAIVENGSTPTNPVSATTNSAQSSVAPANPTISGAAKRNHNGSLVQSPFTAKTNILNAGKAVLLKGNHVKSTIEFRVQVSWNKHRIA